MRIEDAPAVAELTTQPGYPVAAAAQSGRIEDLLAQPRDHAPLVAVDAFYLRNGYVLEKTSHIFRKALG